MKDLFWLDLQLFAANDDGGGDPNAGGNGGDGDGDQNAGDDGNTPRNDGKTFTQEELNRILSDRLKRERRQWEQQLEEERKKAAMTEAERLKVEKEEAERKAEERVAAANARIVQAEARTQALALGVRAERVNAVLRLADLSNVTVDDDGEPDVAAIGEAVKKVLEDVPELKGSPEKVGGSGNPGGSNDGQVNPWAKSTFNLTEQGRILRENPELARRLRAEAGK